MAARKTGAPEKVQEVKEEPKVEEKVEPEAKPEPKAEKAEAGGGRFDLGNDMTLVTSPNFNQNRIVQKRQIDTTGTAGVL